ncbi:hypothetical protein [Acidiphilium sp. MT5]
MALRAAGAALARHLPPLRGTNRAQPAQRAKTGYGALGYALTILCPAGPER